MLYAAILLYRLDLFYQSFMLASPDTSTPIDAEEGHNDNADGLWPSILT